MDLRGYFGDRERTSVLGLWNVVDVRILRAFWVLTPLRVAFAAWLALALGFFGFELPPVQGKSQRAFNKNDLTTRWRKNESAAMSLGIGPLKLRL
jgi:hypothetical protein